MDDAELKDINGGIISISTYSAMNNTDMPRGKMPDKIPRRVFNNEITLLYRYWGFKQINLKIFSNGKLQMTGIIDPTFETKLLADYLINIFKNMKYRVYKTFPQSIANYDYIVCWNNETQSLDYWRRNIETYSLDVIISNGLKYNFTSTNWLNSVDAYNKLTDYISCADTELAILDNLRMELLNTYEYSNDLRLKLYNQLTKYKQIKKVEKKKVLQDNAKVKDYIINLVIYIIKFYKSYKTRISQLIKSDTSFLDDINTKYFDIIKAKFTSVVDNPADDCNYLEFDTVISLYNDYKLTDIKTELINSDYNNRFNNNLVKIHELLSTPEYGIYNYYYPDNQYAGIIAKFMYNPLYLDTTKYKLGKCYCAESCVTNSKQACVSISISIFRTGSIIITAAKEIPQLLCVYEFLNALFAKHYNEISYIDINDAKDYFLLNEERKLMRKEQIIYIKKTAIRVD